jgi:hypothetical protein
MLNPCQSCIKVSGGLKVNLLFGFVVVWMFWYWIFLVCVLLVQLIFNSSQCMQKQLIFNSTLNIQWFLWFDFCSVSQPWGYTIWPLKYNAVTWFIHLILRTGSHIRTCSHYLMYAVQLPGTLYPKLKPTGSLHLVKIARNDHEYVVDSCLGWLSRVYQVAVWS